MPSTIALILRHFCMVVTLLALVARAAEPEPSLRGATREQVIRQLGEPRSQMSAGNRLIMLYPQERVIFRDGVVVEVEPIYAEPVRRAPPPTPATSQSPTAEEPATGPAAPAPAAAVPGPAAPAAAVPAAPPAVAPTETAAKDNGPTEPAATAASEPKLEIKLVRPPSAGGPQPAPRRPSKAAPAPSKTVASAEPAPEPGASAAAKAPAPAATGPKKGPGKKQAAPALTLTPVATKETATEKAATKEAAPGEIAPKEPSTAKTSRPQPAKTEAVGEPEGRTEVPGRAAEEKPDTGDGEKIDAELSEAEKIKRAKVIEAARRRLEVALDSADPDPTPSIFSARTYVITLVIVVGGIWYLVWRIRQRQLELEATAVSRTPFVSATSGTESGGVQFTADVLAKLEWKGFEELVEAYYSKTGVVAARMKGGPSGPAQVKISWKGEARPFAYVRCISAPSGLIEIKPLQELFTLLAAEDIRRGYIVTTGRFSVAARDYAEEKHLTLLPGDIFLEKLNALPGPARAELMQMATVESASTPSCTACEAKMSRSTDNPPVWRCASHPDITFPVKD